MGCVGLGAYDGCACGREGVEKVLGIGCRGLKA